MNCQQIDKYVYEYCDGNLSPEIALQIEEHLTKCVTCNNMVQLTYMENAVLKDALTVDAIDDNFTSRVMGAVSARQTIQSQADIHSLKTSRTRKVSLFIAAAAAIVLLITGVLPDFYNTFNIGNKSAQFELATKDIADNQLESDQALVTDPDIFGTGSTPTNPTTLNDGGSGDPGVTVSNNDSGNTVSGSTSINESTNNNEVIQIAMRSVTDASVTDAPISEDISTKSLQSDMTLGTRDDTSAALKVLSPNRYRSYAVSLANNADKVLVMPVDLPENYILNVSSDTGSVINFTYTEVNTNQTVEISVEPYSAPMSYMSVAADKEQQDNKTSVAESSTQLLEVIAEYENIAYLVKIKSSLSNEELLNLAESIKLGQL